MGIRGRWSIAVGSALVCLGFAAACAESEILRVDLRLDPDDQSVIIALATRDSVAVYARDISEARTIRPVDPLSLGPESSDEVEVTAVFYRSPLSALGIESGELSHSIDAPARGRLPSADRVETLTVTDGDRSDWAEQDDLPQVLDSLRIGYDNPCGAFSGAVVPLGTAGPPMFALALDDEWVLIGTSTRLVDGASPRAFLVNAAGEVVAVDGMPSSFFDGYREDDGTVWLGGERGVVYEAKFESSPEPRLEVVASSTLSTGQDVHTLVGPASGQPREHFALTSTVGRDVDGPDYHGSFEHFDGQSWNKYRGLFANPHDAAYVGPGHGLYVKHWEERTLFTVRDGEWGTVEVGAIKAGQPFEVESIPGVGLVVGTSKGEVVVRADEQAPWTLLPPLDLQGVRALHAYEDGFVYIAGLTAMVRVLADRTVCRPNGIAGRRDLVFQRDIGVLRRAIIVPLAKYETDESYYGEQYVAWFRR